MAEGHLVRPAMLPSGTGTGQSPRLTTGSAANFKPLLAAAAPWLCNECVPLGAFPRRSQRIDRGVSVGSLRSSLQISSVGPSGGYETGFEEAIEQQAESLPRIRRTPTGMCRSPLPIRHNASLPMRWKRPPCRWTLTRQANSLVQWVWLVRSPSAAASSEIRENWMRRIPG